MWSIRRIRPRATTQKIFELQTNRLINTNVAVIEKIRNVGVVAHIDAGKTTTTEQMLYVTGEIKKAGRVDEGDTMMDFLPQERERGITISAAAITFEWKGYEINLIDTPGHVDFTVEVERSARVLDGSIIIVDAVSGVQAQTRTVWKQISKKNIPAVAFINKMDRDGADFEKSLKSLCDKLNAKFIPIQYPIGSENKFEGAIDLIGLNKIIWANTSSKEKAIPIITKLDSMDENYNAAMEYRKRMIETLADLDEEFMNNYFESNDGETLTTSQIINTIRRCCHHRWIIPTVCGAALKSKGIEPLLDSVITFLPSPMDVQPPVLIHKTNSDTIRLVNNSDELCAFVFKIIHDSQKGTLAYARIFGGSITGKQVVQNTTRNVKERINQIMKINADDLGNVSGSTCGSVCCLIGLKNTKTGDTLTSLDDKRLHSYVLEGLTIPRPVFSLSVEAEMESQQIEMEEGLSLMCIEDPSLQYEINKESGKTLLHGVGELHLEIAIDRIRRQFNLNVTTGQSYIAYRETLHLELIDHHVQLPNGMKSIQSSYTYEKMILQKKLFASIEFEITGSNDNAPPHIDYEKGLTQILSAEEFMSLSDGAQEACLRGPRGFPIVGINLKIIKVFKRPGETTHGALRACIAMAIDNLFRSDAHVLLEPYMLLEVEVPPVHVGNILSDLTSERLAQIKEVHTDDINRSVIIALVPFEKMLGYSTRIRSISQGEAFYTLEFHSYLPAVQF